MNSIKVKQYGKNNMDEERKKLVELSKKMFFILQQVEGLELEDALNSLTYLIHCIITCCPDKEGRKTLIEIVYKTLKNNQDLRDNLEDIGDGLKDYFKKLK